MTQEQKRIKIAEKVGWKFHPLTEHLYSEQEKADAIMCWVRPGNDPWQMERVPDYFNDLNAMHEAEMNLPRQLNHIDYWQKGYGRFQTILAELTITPYSATAAQRAEAFGKTLSLW